MVQESVISITEVDGFSCNAAAADNRAAAGNGVGGTVFLLVGAALVLLVGTAVLLPAGTGSGIAAYHASETVKPGAFVELADK